MELWKKRLIKRATACALDELEQRRRDILRRCLDEWRPYVLTVMDQIIPNRETNQDHAFNEILSGIQQATPSCQPIRRAPTT